MNLLKTWQKELGREQVKTLSCNHEDLPELNPQNSCISRVERWQQINVMVYLSSKKKMISYKIFIMYQ